LALGTVTGGLKKLEPFFEPILAEIVRKNLEEDQWHADETRWRVFVDIEGKVGHKWYLWLVRSRSAVVFLLDPSRAARVPASPLGKTKPPADHGFGVRQKGTGSGK
jgi:hypothetical protein